MINFGTASRPLHASELRLLFLCPWRLVAEPEEILPTPETAPATIAELVDAATVRLKVPEALRQEKRELRRTVTKIIRTKESR